MAQRKRKDREQRTWKAWETMLDGVREKKSATSEMGKLALLNKWQFNKVLKNQQQ